MHGHTKQILLIHDTRLYFDLEKKLNVFDK